LSGFNHPRTRLVQNEFGFKEFDFEDPLAPGAKKNKDWLVPENTATDGASIPRILWSIIGSPLTGKYVEASVVHDFYCSKRTEHWKAVHRVFYKAMRVSGVGPAQARLLYIGVRFGGPRWTAMNVHNARRPIPSSAPAAPTSTPTIDPAPIPARLPPDAAQMKLLEGDPFSIDLRNCFWAGIAPPQDEADGFDLDEEKGTDSAVYLDVGGAYESIKKDISREETVPDAQKLEIIDLSLELALQDFETRHRGAGAKLRRRLSITPAFPLKTLEGF
jgi:hypothetical protein